MHWIDRVAKTLLRRSRKNVIASGISISGHIHIGHCNDIFIADGIRRAIEEFGGKAEAIWYADDFDPMRRIPWPLSEDYKQYLGMPYLNIPSPDPNYRNFVDFFARPFIESLEDFGIRVKIYSGAEVYQSGKMAVLIRTALEKVDEIRAILNKYRSKRLPEDWLPYDAVCENCGKLATTRAYSWHDNYVSYKCEGCDYSAGCGHEGEADYTKGEGKLTWRVEWPARWKLLGVTCEPFGKDHAVVGGSYDTGKLIAKRVFDCEAPYPVPYEWVSLKGRRMSSSKGVVFTLPQWLEIAEPELLRYFIFRSKPMKAKEFDQGLPLLDFYDEYDLVEGVYFGKVSVGERRRAQFRRIYELSQILGPPRSQPQRVPFRFAAVLGQVMRDPQHAIDILTARGMFVDQSESDVKLALSRLNRARNWVTKYAPQHLRFELLRVLPDETRQALTEGQKAGLRQLASDLAAREYGPVELHNRVYEVAQGVGLKPPELFEAIYLVLIGLASGPRVGGFISALDKKFVIERFKEASM
ncbi:MAG: lysine--tRNA ligase [Candidatus Hodarchaeaceae archaeon]|nr:lysine--tRNA ligase [Candidatus Hodarchaeaceae archaeon]